MAYHLGRISQHTGKNGEQLAESVLSGLGIEEIRKVGTPVKLIPVTLGGSKRRGYEMGNTYRVTFGERVNGDRHGIIPSTGRYVLIEVKTRWDKNLTWSDFEPHQHADLQRHYEFHGLSLVVYVHNSGVFVMEYPIAGFEPGKGITPERARELDDVDRSKIEDEVKYGRRKTIHRRVSIM